MKSVQQADLGGFAHHSECVVLRLAKWVLSVACALLLPVWVHAQDLPYATGAIPLTGEQISELPPTPLRRAFLPEHVDLSSYMPPVGDQGRLGSCTAWAGAYYNRGYYTLLEQGKEAAPQSLPSPGFVYGLIYSPDGAEGCGGSNMLQLTSLLSQTGAATLRDYPYSDSACPKPDTGLVDRISILGTSRIDAGRSITPAYTRRHSGKEGLAGQTEEVREDGWDFDILPDLIKTELARGRPVTIAVQTDRAFHSLPPRAVWTRKADINRRDDGWHSITLVGYDEAGQYFKFVNSWGPSWSDGGYGRLSYQTVIDHRQPGWTLVVDGVKTPDFTGEDIPPAPPSPRPSPDLADMPEPACGRVDLVSRGGKDIVTGYVGSGDDLSRIKMFAAAGALETDIDLRPWPQCETITTLRAPLGDPDKPGIRLERDVFSAGDDFVIDLAMAPFKGFLHVAYIQADGNVVNLIQQKQSLVTLERDAVMRVGDGSDPWGRFEVSGPFGSEMLIAIASASPLFDEPRPTVENERVFLTALRKAILARPDPAAPERRISASYAIFETKEALQ